MKKIILFLLLFLPICVKAEDLNLAENSKSAIMIEASTGEIIYEKNAHEKLPPASMTKMMSMLLIMENIEAGKLKLNEIITASVKASSMGGSQIFLEAGEKMSVEELLKGIAIGSGNDATMALAEKIGGSEEEFVKLMNNKAKQLNLKNTNFKNPTGLDAENHYSSAYDMAMIAKELVKHEKILEFTSTYEAYLRENTDNKFWLVNTNRLVRYYQGVDGLKTGFTQEAGYCLTSTAKKNNMRLITVVMAEPDSATRNNETTAMLDYGFNAYSVDTIIKNNDKVGKIKVEMGKKKEVDVISSQEINILNNNNNEKRNVNYKIKLNKISAPITKGTVVGKLYVYEKDKDIMNIDLKINESVSKANIINVFLRNLEKILTGMN